MNEIKGTDNDMITVSRSKLESMVIYSQELENELKRLKTQQNVMISMFISVRDKLGINEIVNIKSVSEAMQYANKYWFKDTMALIKEVVKDKMKAAFTGDNSFNFKEHLRIDFNLFKDDIDAIMPIIKEWDSVYITQNKELSQSNSIGDGSTK